MIYFWTYWLQETWLDICLKRPVSQDRLTSNMFNGPKHCPKLNDSIFAIFIDPCESISGLKSLSELYEKSEDYLLTLRLSITTILFLIEVIYSNIFRCNYLRTKKHFLNFFLAFCKFRSDFEYFQKKDDPHSWCIFELTDS